MKTPASPLRFLGLVLGGWIGARLAILAPGWITEPAAAEQPRAPVLAMGSPPGQQSAPEASGTADLDPAPDQVTILLSPARPTAKLAVPGPPLPLHVVPPPLAAPKSALPVIAAALPTSLPQADPVATPARAAPPGRWSLSAWAFIRRGREEQLAAAGQLGGSQVGARGLLRITDRAALSLRLSSPVERASAAEAALGLEVQPLRGIPVKLLAERRQALGSSGRSAFALLAHGGVSEQPLVGRLRLDGYAQAGVVGTRSRDAFVDGSVAVSVSLSERLSLGAGAWGAAQPGITRLDVGPQLSYRLPQVGRGARIAAEWRVRVAGDARPGSGPALTLATDF